jgi:hypothetical protein
VFFKLDERITTSVYMGERWVAPETFTVVVQQGSEVSVDARAHLVDVSGTSEAVATWTTDAPEMVAVSTNVGHEVRLTIRRPGQSKLTVSSAAGTSELSVVAANDAGSWRVDFTRR